MLLGGCTAPLLRFEPEAVPAVLMPASLAAVEDLRARYREVLCAVLRTGDSEVADARCDAALQCMALEGAPTGRPVHLGPPRMRLAIVPGYGADCRTDVVSVLADARVHFAERGWPSEALHVEGLSSSIRNAGTLRRALLDAPLAPGERVVLVGYSRGAADMLEALARHPEITPRIAAAVSLAGAVMGSPLADDPPGLLLALMQVASGGACTAADGGVFASLRRTERMDFLARFPPATYGVPLYSLGAFAAPERTSRVLQPMQRRLAALDPRNDGQVLSTDQVIPGSALLGYLDADHWAVALPLSRSQPLLAAVAVDHNDLPRGAVLRRCCALSRNASWAGSDATHATPPQRDKREQEPVAEGGL